MTPRVRVETVNFSLPHSVDGAWGAYWLAVGLNGATDSVAGQCACATCERTDLARLADLARSRRA